MDLINNGGQHTLKARGKNLIIQNTFCYVQHITNLIQLSENGMVILYAVQ